MNFSEYTLVSFGDSFTFGQDTVPHYSHDAHGKPEVHKQWKKECNGNSYTKVIADSLGFKNSLNFGILAGSNERSLTLLESFLRSNPTMKIFVLFNFTSSSRFLQFFKIDSKPAYDSVDMLPNVTVSQFIDESRYTGINKRSIENHYTYFRNSLQDVYNHIKDKRMLYYMLSSHNVPHATFDIVNDTDYRMLRDNPINYIHSNDGFGTSFMYNDDESYVFKEMDFLKSYHKELVDKSSLLAHMGMDYLSDERNVLNYTWKMGKDNHNDSDYYISEHGAHWNSEGHREVAKLIENFINEKYDN